MSPKSKTPLAIVILAAGKGTRMNSDLPKVMHPLAGKPMISWLIDTCESLNPQKIIAVIGPDMKDLQEAVKPHTAVVQKVRDGTGGALKCALPVLKGFKGDVLVVLGDAPLITKATLKNLIAAKRKNAASLLGCEVQNSMGYGRLVLDKNDELIEIVEEKDASVAQKSIRLINTGAFCLDASKLKNWCERLTNKNAQKEFYITQIPALIREDGDKTAVAITRDEAEIIGCNTRADLAHLEKLLQNRLRESAMNAGVHMNDPETVYLWHDTKIAAGTTIEPNVFFGPKVTVSKNVTIKAFCHIEESSIASGAIIGPFARLRPGTRLEENVKVGNFVEIKKSSIGQGSKINHLAYVGDTKMAENVNFSAGAITVNYDGFDKFKTTIGRNVMVGSNVNLVAPLTIKEGAILAAGSTITQNIPADSLVIARDEETIKPGWAANFRKHKSKKKKP